jgi:hypothetical protein
MTLQRERLRYQDRQLPEEFSCSLLTRKMLGTGKILGNLSVDSNDRS